MNTVEVRARCGGVFLVSECDAGLVDDFGPCRINHHGYVVTSRCRDRQQHALHRLIMGSPEGGIVDHIDRNKLNCTRDNLRIVDKNQSAWNRDKLSGVKTKSKYIGAFKQCLSKKDRKAKGWFSCIGHQGRRIYLGTFATEIEAAMAYDKKCIELRGTYAVLNFPDRALAAADSGDDEGGIVNNGASTIGGPTPIRLGNGRPMYSIEQAAHMDCPYPPDEDINQDGDDQ